MERINFGYSLKNIPIPSRTAYMKAFINKADSFLQQARWKFNFFDKPSGSDKTPNYGFKSE